MQPALEITTMSTASVFFDETPAGQINIHVGCLACESCEANLWMVFPEQECPDCPDIVLWGEIPIEYFPLPSLEGATARSYSERIGWHQELWLGGVMANDSSEPSLDALLHFAGIAHESGDPEHQYDAAWSIASAFVGFGFAPPLGTVRLVHPRSDRWLENFVGDHLSIRLADVRVVEAVLATIDEFQRTSAAARWKDLPDEAKHIAGDPALRERTAHLLEFLRECIETERGVTREIVDATNSPTLSLLMRSKEILDAGGAASPPTAALGSLSSGDVSPGHTRDGEPDTSERRAQEPRNPFLHGLSTSATPQPIPQTDATDPPGEGKRQAFPDRCRRCRVEDADIAFEGMCFACYREAEAEATPPLWFGFFYAYIAPLGVGAAAIPLVGREWGIMMAVVAYAVAFGTLDKIRWNR